MIVIRKKLNGIIPYRLIYWPTEAVLKELTETLPLPHYARVESATADVQRAPCIVGHHLSITLLINLQRPLGDIYKDFIDNARIRIHKAEKLGSRLDFRGYSGGADEEGLVPQFVALYNNFVRGKPTQTSPVTAEREYSFFPFADLNIAYLDGQPICGHLNLVDREGGIVRLQDGANKRFDDPATARLAGIVNVYLHWHELQKYREHGLATYDFGSLGQVQDSVGVNRFKMQFGGTIIREHNYLLAGMPRTWRTVVTLMSLLGRWQRRLEMEKAGERWREMPLEEIRRTIETSIANFQRNLQVRSSRTNVDPSERATANTERSTALAIDDRQSKASQPA